MPPSGPRGGGTAGGGGGPPGFLAGLAGRLGIPTGALGGAAALTAGVNIAGAVTSSAYTNQLSNINMELESPFFRLDARAALGRTAGQNALNIRHGDAARAYAQMQLANDPASGKLLSQDLLLEGKRVMENPTTIGGHMAKDGPVSGAMARGKASMGSALQGPTVASASAQKEFETAHALRMKGEATGGWRGAAMISAAKQLEANVPRQGGAAGSFSGTLIQGANIPNERTDVIAQNRARMEQMSMQAERQQRALEAKMMEDPMFNDRLNRTYAASLGDSSMMRALGMSGRDVTLRTGIGNKTYSAAGWIRGQAFNQGRDPGEFMAAAQELSSVAGRGFLGRYGSTLGAKTGGLHNVSQILGVGAQFGGGGFGGGRSFLGGIQNRIGRGGVDVTAGMNVTNLGMGAMMSSNFQGTSGAGLMDTLLQAAYTGTTGGDMRKAREMAGGLGFAERERGGGIDQINKALNLSAAMQAAPEAPWTVRNTLSSLSEASIVDIMKSGKVPDMLADNGVTVDMVKKYYSATNMTRFARFGSAAEYGTTDQAAAVARYRESGGLGYMKGMSKGSRERELNLLSGALSTGSGASMRESRSRLDIEAGTEGVLPSFGGKGARDSLAGNTVIAKANETKGILELVESGKVSEAKDLFKSIFGHMPTAQEMNELTRKGGQRAMTPGGNVGTAIEGVTEAFNRLIGAMREEFGGGGAKPGARTPAGP